MPILDLCDESIRKLGKLEIAVLDFLTVNDVTYHIHGGFPKMHTCYFELDETICVEQKIHIHDVDCLCHTNLFPNAKCLDNNWQDKLLRNLNRINRTLEYGSFELDLEKGDVRYRTYFKHGNVIYWEDLEMFLGYPMQVIRSKYPELFCIAT